MNFVEEKAGEVREKFCKRISNIRKHMELSNIPKYTTHLRHELEMCDLNAKALFQNRSTAEFYCRGLVEELKRRWPECRFTLLTEGYDPARGQRNFPLVIEKPLPPKKRARDEKNS